jgi:hypothetical protein
LKVYDVVNVWYVGPMLIVSAWETSWSIFLWLYRSLIKCFLS